jgi:hypothetical protein
MTRLYALLPLCCLVLTACGGGGGGNGNPTTPNLPPQVTLPTSIAIDGPLLTLPIEASDPEGGPLTFAWRVISGPGIPRIDDAARPTPGVQFPLAGTYGFDVAVSDDDGHTTHALLDCVVSGADFTISVHLKNLTTSGAGVPVSLVWSDTSATAAEATSADDGWVVFPAAFGQPDDFRIVVH